MTKTGGAPGFAVLRGEAAAYLRRHAQKLEGVRRDVGAVELLRAHAGGPQDVLVAAAGVSAEDVILLAELQVFRRLHEAAVRRAVRGPDREC